MKPDKKYIFPLGLIPFILISNIWATDYIYQKSESPYHITQNILISLGAEENFIVEAGVEIIISDGISFTVDQFYGSVNMLGTEIDSIVIRGLGNSSIINFTINSSAQFEYVIFKSVRGGFSKYMIETREMELHHLSFINCDFAIRFNNSSYNSVSNCMFDSMKGNRCITTNYSQPQDNTLLKIVNNHFYNVSASLISFAGSHYSINENNFIFKGNTVKKCSSKLDVVPSQSALIANNLFWKNNSFAVVNNSSQVLVITNNVFYDNESDGSLIYSYSYYTNIANSIFWKNDTKENATLQVWSYGSSLAHSISIRNTIFPVGREAVDDGGGLFLSQNLYEFDPQFDFSSDSSFHLAAGSPAIDAGIAQEFMNDTNGTRNDLGIWGGNDFYIYPYAINYGRHYSTDPPNYNLRTYLRFFNDQKSGYVTIGSASLLEGTHFNFSGESLPITLLPGDIKRMEIFYRPKFIGQHLDTLFLTSINGLPYNKVSIDLYGEIKAYLSGNISGHLFPAKEPYRYENLTIPEDDTLFIEPGVEFIVTENSLMKVLGVLICGRKNADEINFHYNGYDVGNFSMEFSNVSKQSIISNTKFNINCYQDNVAFIKQFSGNRLLLDQINVFSSRSSFFALMDPNTEIQIFNSYFDNCSFGQGFIKSNESRIILVNNIFDRFSMRPFFIESDNYLYFVNNTFYRSIHPSNLNDDNPLFNFSKGIKIIRNNIFWPETDYRGIMAFQENSRTEPYHLLMDHNIIKGAPDKALVNYHGTANYGTLEFHDNLSDEPQFNGGDPFDYHLAKNSAGVNGGDEHPWYNDIDGTRNNIGAFGGTGLIVPYLNYNTFWHNNPKNFFWIQSLYYQEQQNDSFFVRIRDFDNGEVLSQIGSSEIYPSVYKTSIFLENEGSYFLENVYTPDSGMPYSETVLVIIGVSEENKKRKSYSASKIGPFKVQPSNSKQNTPVNYLAWRDNVEI